MHREGEEIHVSTEEARGAETGTGLRYMLGVGLVMVILALSAIWIIGAISGEQHRPDNATKLDTPIATGTAAADQRQPQAN